MSLHLKRQKVLSHGASTCVVCRASLSLQRREAEQGVAPRSRPQLAAAVTARPRGQVLGRAAAALGVDIPPEDARCRAVRLVAPGKVMVCVTFSLPRAVLASG